MLKVIFNKNYNQENFVLMSPLIKFSDTKISIEIFEEGSSHEEINELYVTMLFRTSKQIYEVSFRLVASHLLKTETVWCVFPQILMKKLQSNEYL